MQHLKNLLDGMRQVLVLWPHSDYVIPSRGGFRQDAANLHGDYKRVAAGLYKNANLKRDAKAHDR